jgi:hypothetical protein
VIFLEQHEARAYQGGERLFALNTGTVKVRAA